MFLLASDRYEWEEAAYLGASSNGFIFARLNGVMAHRDVARVSVGIVGSTAWHCW